MANFLLVNNLAINFCSEIKIKKIFLNILLGLIKVIFIVFILSSWNIKLFLKFILLFSHCNKKVKKVKIN